jgi:nucleoside-diphosphate-sugar epimerase
MLFQVTANGFRFVTGKLRPSPGIHESVVRFYHALKEGKAPPVPAEEGRRIVAWMEAVSGDADEQKRRAFSEAPAAVPPRVLVTGSSGFLGGALLRRLRDSGEAVRVLRRRPGSCESDPKLHVVYGDLGDPTAVDRAVAGVDVVYHVGAAMKGWAEDFQRGTVLGTQNVINACLRHGVKRLVYVSSLSVLDHAGHRPGVPVKESAPVEPFPDRRGAYTQTKLAAENLVAEAARTRRLPAVIVRPGQIFGKGAEKVSPSGTFGLAGRLIVDGDGRHLLPLVYSEDVVDALLLAEKYPGPHGSKFHIVDPNPIDQRAYIARQQTWARPAGSRIKPVYCPEWVLLPLALLVETAGAVLKRNMPLTRYRIKSLPPLSPFDLSAAMNELGWRPRVGVQEGLKRTFGAC